MLLCQKCYPKYLFCKTSNTRLKIVRFHGHWFLIKRIFDIFSVALCPLMLTKSCFVSLNQSFHVLSLQKQEQIKSKSKVSLFNYLLWENKHVQCFTILYLYRLNEVLIILPPNAVIRLHAPVGRGLLSPLSAKSCKSNCPA